MASRPIAFTTGPTAYRVGPLAYGPKSDAWIDTLPRPVPGGDPAMPRQFGAPGTQDNINVRRELAPGVGLPFPPWQDPETPDTSRS
jgi:hypothetical protein